MTSAAIYARVSSARQKEEQTIISQTAALRAHAEQLGVDVPPEWVFEDEGHSGATLVRPALERLRDLVAQVPVDVVFCYSPDRLARKYAYQVLLVEEFARAGVEVRFVKGPSGGSPEDALLVQFQGMIAEYERAQIAERTRRGKAHRARTGVANVLSGAPYGYRYVRRSEHAEARYDVVEHEAAVVAEMFRRYVEDGTSIAGLLRWLSEAGTPTRTGKTRWDRSTVAGMLRNPAYAGQAAFGKTMRSPDRPAPNRMARLTGRTTPRSTATVDRPRQDWVHISVPPIISEDTFARAQRRLADNRHFAARNTKVPSLLQGLLVCASCSYACYRTSTRTTAGKIYYYRCLGSDDWRYQHGRVCANTPVRADYLDEVVWTHVTGLLADPGLITAELDRRLDHTHATDPATAQRTRLDLALAKTTASITRLIEAYQEQLLSLDELRARMPDLRARETSLRAQLDALAAQLVDRDTYLKLAENLEGFLTRLQDNIREATVEERQRVLRLLVKEILVGPERITIRHSIPATTPDPTPGYLLRGRSHLPVLPVLHVGRVISGDGDHRLDAVRGAQRAGQRRWDTQAQHGQRLGQALAQAGGGTGVGALEFLGEGFELRLGHDRRLGVIGLAHPLGHRRGQVIRQLVGHVPDLVQLTPTDHRVIEHAHHGRAQRLAAVDTDEDRPCGVQAPITQPGQQISDHAGVLRRALGQPQRMLRAVDADAQRHHAQVLAEVHPVDHQRDQVQVTQRLGEQLAQRGLGRGDEPAADRRLARRRGRAFGTLPDRFQPDRVATSRDPGQHLAHRHPTEDLGLAEQLVGRHRHLGSAVRGAHPRPGHRHPPPTQGHRAGLAAVPHPSPGRVVLALRPAHRGHVLFHQRLHHLQPGADRAGEQTLAHVLGDLGHRHAHRLRHRVAQLGARHRRPRLVVLGYGGPLLVELLGGSPTPTTRQASSGGPPPKFNDGRECAQ